MLTILDAPLASFSIHMAVDLTPHAMENSHFTLWELTR